MPTFVHAVGGTTYTLLGRDPAVGGVTVIPTVLVPISLSFNARKSAGKPFIMDASVDVPQLLRSPVYSKFAFADAGTTQYADALLRTTFPKNDSWHTLLGKPEVRPISITIPASYGYMLTSNNNRTLAVVDIQFIQKEVFKLIPKEVGKLVILLTHNITFYTDGDATECCSWGTHGIDSATGNSFVLSSYLNAAPFVVTDKDVQPLTQQLAEFINDPLHDPLAEVLNVNAPGNKFPAWMRLANVRAGDQGRCGGSRIATAYFLLEPTDINPKNNIPASPAFIAQAGTISWHLQNAALLPWYTGLAESLGTKFSFPDAHVLTSSANPCPAGHASTEGKDAPSETHTHSATTANGHQLIGYWTGNGGAGTYFPLRDVSPEWDVIIVAFAPPDKNAPEGTMKFQTRAGIDSAQFKNEIASLKSQGKKVMISLGGGGEHFTLADPKRVPNFVASVTSIVSEYGFDGIDIDFESPSLDIDPGDTDYKHPITPSIVNLISALRQLHDHFGPAFMISLVPEGTQIPSGYPNYGGQFGSYLAITYAIRDILSFIDVQSYNTPPLEGLDGEIYQPGTVDYHVAMTEILLHGFNVGGDPKQYFPPMPPDKVAVGFLNEDTTPAIVGQAMDYIITGKAPVGTKYKLRSPAGYPGMIGAMFWTIDDDRLDNYPYSNIVGPQLHNYPAAK